MRRNAIGYVEAGKETGKLKRCRSEENEKGKLNGALPLRASDDRKRPQLIHTFNC